MSERDNSAETQVLFPLTITICCANINLYLDSCVSRKGVWTILPDITHVVYVWKLVSLDGVVRHLMALFLFLLFIILLPKGRKEKFLCQ